MMKKYWINIIPLLLFMLFINADAVQRFPKPEFDTGHKIPATQVSHVQPVFFEMLDIFVFLGSMGLITWLIIKKRSRRGVFWMSVFSLLYFGLYRQGCICPVGSLQNVTMALFHPEYNIPLTAIIFFTVPLGFTLFFGRTFCAGICPLGALQDITGFFPISLKPWIRYTLGLIPFIYLGLALLFAATGSDFIVCRYDPFVGFFRHNASAMMFTLGGILLVTGVFIARPYCRFLCPYGVLLNLVSRFSGKHISIAPGACINCKLCEHACPYDAIDKPTGQEVKSDNRELVKKMILYCLITPLLIVICGWTLSRYHESLAMVNFKVRLAHELLQMEKTGDQHQVSQAVNAFRSSGEAVNSLFREVQQILENFRKGTWILGGFLGLVLGITLSRLTLYHFKNEYNVNKGSCYSCTRCLPYCPVKPENGTSGFNNLSVDPSKMKIDHGIKS